MLLIFQDLLNVSAEILVAGQKSMSVSTKLLVSKSSVKGVLLKSLNMSANFFVFS